MWLIIYTLPIILFFTDTSHAENSWLFSINLVIWLLNYVCCGIVGGVASMLNLLITFTNPDLETLAMIGIQLVCRLLFLSLYLF